MEKEEALDLLKLDPIEKPETISLRYEQITAFLSPDDQTPAVLKELCSKANATITEAFETLPQAQQKTTAAAGTQVAASLPSPVTFEPVIAKIKQLICPNAGLPAGNFLSDQWWLVYRRPVLLGLTAVATGLYFLPEAGIYTPPASRSTAGPLPTLTPPHTGPLPTLNPEPRPGPVVITADPTQDPVQFLYGIFLSLKKGETVNLDFKQADALVLKLNLTKPRFKCPDFYYSVPTDAMQIQSRLLGLATIRVREKYFTGDNTIDDYTLVSQNGVWRLQSVSYVGVDTPERAPEIIPDPHIVPEDPSVRQLPTLVPGPGPGPGPTQTQAYPGDPVAFVIEHISAASHLTYWKVLSNLDPGYKDHMNEDEFKRLYVNGWFIPLKSDLGTAITLESQAADKAQVRVIPSYVTRRAVTTPDGTPADLIFYLVNHDGKWLIEDIRQASTSGSRRASPWK